jgi:hypothetical protein
VLDGCDGEHPLVRGRGARTVVLLVARGGHQHHLRSPELGVADRPVAGEQAAVPPRVGADGHVDDVDWDLGVGGVSERPGGRPVIDDPVVVEDPLDDHPGAGRVPHHHAGDEGAVAGVREQPAVAVGDGLLGVAGDAAAEPGVGAVEAAVQQGDGDAVTGLARLLKRR